MMESLSDTLGPPAAAFGGFRLVRLLRRDDPFELWKAEALDPAARGVPLVLRRAAPDSGHAGAIGPALARASQIARRVSHSNVVLCHGTVEIEGQTVQVAEHAHDLDLEALIQAAHAFGTELEIALSVWIARQMLEAIVHASSLGFVHGSLAPRHIYLTRGGAVKVDFGIARVEREDGSIASLNRGRSAYDLPRPGSGAANPNRSPDTYAIACMLWELLAGEQYAAASKRAGGHASIKTRRAAVPDSIEASLKRALDLDSTESPHEAKSLNAQLTRAFYVDLDADDIEHGHRRLLAWAAQLLPDVGASLEAIDPSDLDAIERVDPDEAGADAAPRSRRKGVFTQMLEERALPVTPQPLTPADRDSNVFTNPPWLALQLQPLDPAGRSASALANSPPHALHPLDAAVRHASALANPPSHALDPLDAAVRHASALANPPSHALHALDAADRPASALALQSPAAHDHDSNASSDPLRLTPALSERPTESRPVPRARSANLVIAPGAAGPEARASHEPAWPSATGLDGDLPSSESEPTGLEAPPFPRPRAPFPSSKRGRTRLRRRPRDLEVLIWFIVGFALTIMSLAVYNLGQSWIRRPPAQSPRPPAAAPAATPTGTRERPGRPD